MELFLYNSRFAIDIGEVRLGACFAFTVSGEASGSEGTTERTGETGGCLHATRLRKAASIFDFL